MQKSGRSSSFFEIAKGTVIDLLQPAEEISFHKISDICEPLFSL
jgi:hypothetical protein